jgi:hypothetical protein
MKRAASDDSESDAKRTKIDDTDLFDPALQKKAFDIWKKGSDGSGYLSGLAFMAWQSKQKVRFNMEVAEDGQRYRFDIEFSGACLLHLEKLSVYPQDILQVALKGVSIEMKKQSASPYSIPLALKFQDGVIVKFIRSRRNPLNDGVIVNTWLGEPRSGSNAYICSLTKYHLQRVLTRRMNGFQPRQTFFHPQPISLISFPMSALHRFQFNTRPISKISPPMLALRIFQYNPRPIFKIIILMQAPHNLPIPNNPNLVRQVHPSLVIQRQVFIRSSLPYRLSFHLARRCHISHAKTYAPMNSNQRSPFQRGKQRSLKRNCARLPLLRLYLLQVPLAKVPSPMLAVVRQTGSLMILC